MTAETVAKSFQTGPPIFSIVGDTTEAMNQPRPASIVIENSPHLPSKKGTWRISININTIAKTVTNPLTKKAALNEHVLESLVQHLTELKKHKC